MNVQMIYNLIQTVAPFDTQMEGDNSGLLVGSPSQEVTGILFALDVTQSVIDEAAALGAELIVSHHPLMFSAIRSLTDESCEGRLIRRLVRENISLISAHTNLDRAVGGINDTLAALCGLVEISGEGFFRSGFLPAPMTARAFADLLEENLRAHHGTGGPDHPPRWPVLRQRWGRLAAGCGGGMRCFCFRGNPSSLCPGDGGRGHRRF